MGTRPPESVALFLIAVIFVFFLAIGVVCLVWPERLRAGYLHPWLREYPEFHIWSLRFGGLIALAGAALVAAVLVDALV
jgi:hypothetical protein